MKTLRVLGALACALIIGFAPILAMADPPFGTAQKPAGGIAQVNPYAWLLPPVSPSTYWTPVGPTNPAPVYFPSGYNPFSGSSFSVTASTTCNSVSALTALSAGNQTPACDNKARTYVYDDQTLAAINALTAAVNSLTTAVNSSTPAGSATVGGFMPRDSGGDDLTDVINHVLNVRPLAITIGGATPYHYISVASTNSTLVSTGAHTLYTLIVHGLNTTAGYVRLYDSGAAPTCSSATGAVMTLAVVATSGNEGGEPLPIPPQGIAFSNGLAFCITGGAADTDNTSAPTGIIIAAAYK